MLFFFAVSRACALVMGAKQTKEDETPTSPKSPRVAPVESGETSNIAQLLKEEAPGRRLYYCPLLERIKETSGIAAELPQWMLPTSDEYSIKRRLYRTLDELKDETANDPSYEIVTRFAALETELAATRKDLSTTQEKLVDMAETQREILAKLQTLIEK